MGLDANSFGILDPAKNVNYGRQDIPSARDSQIRELLLRVSDQGAVDRIAPWMPRDASRVLNVFAERAASLAVRHQDARELRVGLLAAAIARTLTDDERDVLPALALLYRAAEKIGHDPDVQFTAVQKLCGGHGRFLTEFLRRTAVDKSIDAMGYEESHDKQGFKFIRNW